MEEMNKKLDLILLSQTNIQDEIVRLNSKMNQTNQRIDTLDEKFEKKFEETNQRIEALDKKFEKKIDDQGTSLRKDIERLDRKVVFYYNKLDKKLDDNLEEIADMFNMLFTNVPA